MCTLAISMPCHGYIYISIFSLIEHLIIKCIQNTDVSIYIIISIFVVVVCGAISINVCFRIRAQITNIGRVRTKIIRLMLCCIRTGHLNVSCSNFRISNPHAIPGIKYIIGYRFCPEKIENNYRSELVGI